MEIIKRYLLTRMDYPHYHLALSWNNIIFTIVKHYKRLHNRNGGINPDFHFMDYLSNFEIGPIDIMDITS